jgi:hypothetical protein
MTMTETWLGRRSLLQCGAAYAATATLPAAAAPSSAVLPRWETEAAMLRDFMRLRATPGGEICIGIEGLIYGRPPDDLMRAICGFRSAVTMRVREIGPSLYRAEQRESTHYSDLRTGDVLRSIRNPYTGETVIPIGFCSPTNVFHVDTTGTYLGTLPEKREGRIALEWRVADHSIRVTESRYNRFPSSISEEEFPRAYTGPNRDSVDVISYEAERAAFDDRRRDSIAASVHMISDTPWQFWLMMGRRPGHAVWNGYGKKYANFAALPPRFRETVEDFSPGFLADPWNFPVERYGTAAQMRRLKAEGRL